MRCWPSGWMRAGCSRGPDAQEGVVQVTPRDESAAPLPGDDPAGRPAGVHHGREACRAQLRQALLDLTTEPMEPEQVPPRRPPREAWLVDRHFADWPLDEPALLDNLSAWLRPGGRRLRLVGLDFDTTARTLPRFAHWRRDWSHRIEVWRPSDGLMPASARGLVAGETAWQWLDAPDWRLRQLTNPVQLRALQEQLADYLQRCESAWPVTTLGL